MSVAATVATAVIAAAGAWATYALTDGLKAFTTESARRLSIERTPPPTPDVNWQGGPLDAAPGAARPVRIVDFIYTRCPAVCQAAGGVYGQLQRELAGEMVMGSLELLSVGFDLEHDTGEALAAYRRRFGAASGWRSMAPKTAADLEALTRAYGVYIRPDGAGGYVHNAGLSVVDSAGHLVAVYDLEQWHAAALKARELARRRDGQ